MTDGVEIKLYDPKRERAHWTEILLPTQCAVIFKDATTLAPLSSSGEPCERAGDATCTLFDSIETAQRICEGKVATQPNLRCEIFDRQGLAHPPLVVVLHPSWQQRDESGPSWVKRRKLIAAVFCAGALVLLWFDRSHGWSSFIPTFFAINLIVAALRFIYWDFGLRHREQERLKRLGAHRERERRR